MSNLVKNRTLSEAISIIAGAQGQITFCFSPDRVIVHTLNPDTVFEESINYEDPDGISIPVTLIRISEKIKQG